MLAVALVVRLVQIDHNVLWDECYHLLAARSWVAEGSFDIAGGEYVRACVYTWLVSWFTRFADNDLVAGRIPALLSGSALAMLLFCWTSRQAGRAAGWAAALMLCFAGLAVFLSQLVRFYALHALCVLVASVAVFRLCEHARSRRDRAACAAVAVASLAFALLLQPITLIACVALGSYVALRLAPHLPPLLARRPRASAGVAVAALAAAAVLVASGALGPLLASAWGRYEAAPAWGEQHADDLLYYVHWLGEYYGLLWWLSPFAAVAALRRRPVFGLFCVLQFVVPLVLHSFSGSKAPRYLFYAMPFFFALWGVALAELVGRAGRALAPILARARFPGPRHASTLALLGVAGVAALLVLYQRDFRNGVLLMVRPDVRWEVPSRYRGYPDWKAAQPTLQPLADAAEVFLTSSGIKALYYLGDFDYDVNASLRAETDTQAELGIDYRTGKPVITEPASLEAIMRRHPTGLVVAEERRWRHPQNVPAAFSDYLEAHAERVPVPPEWRLLVFRWDRRS